ncbi:MAG TPA: hypothetical protein VM865_01195, partial [Acidobacteriaceae bacterium]|nr:hypothetical protein [Acidobacteriaceae bacterium]
MDPKVITAIIIVVVAALVVAALVMARRKQRTAHIKEHFGPEYDRALTEHGDPARAEAVLAEREARVQKFTIRAL